MQLEGVYAVLPTPFQPNGELDLDSLRRVIDLFIQAGVSGVTAPGVTGEVSRLEDDERPFSRGSSSAGRLTPAPGKALAGETAKP